MTKVFDAYAAYYDLLYRDKDYLAEAGFVEELLASHGVRTGSLLELGCGTGRHAEHLASAGYRVHGKDMSPEMIKLANKRKPREFHEQLSYEVGDVRKSQGDQKFDAVISLFHVVSYQTKNEDLMAMFEAAFSALSEGGVFIFDVWYGPAVLALRPEVRVNRLKDADYEIIRIAEPLHRPNDNLVDVNYEIIVFENSGGFQRLSETHEMRYFFSPEMHFVLNNSGFSVLEEIEWLTSHRLSEDTWSATFVARRV